MRRRALSVIRVRALPGNRSRGVLLAGTRALPVVLGRGGIRANKFEGDGATPRQIPAYPPVVAGRSPSTPAHIAAGPAHWPHPRLVRRYH